MARNLLARSISSALMMAPVLGAGTMARAANDNVPDGNIVKIGHADGEKGQPNLPPPDDNAGDRVVTPQVQAPKYWIGLLGGAISADSPLRAQLDLPENQRPDRGQCRADSPAAKAGLKQHDILLRANDKDLHEMQDLVELVLAEGPQKGQITLDILAP